MSSPLIVCPPNSGAKAPLDVARSPIAVKPTPHTALGGIHAAALRHSPSLQGNSLTKVRRLRLTEAPAGSDRPPAPDPGPGSQAWPAQAQQPRERPLPAR